MSNQNCDCINTCKEEIIKKVNENPKNPAGFKIIEADWEYKSFYPKQRLYLNFIVKSTFTKKDGSESRPQNGHTSIFFSYCPFCGKPLNNDKKEG